MTTTLDRPVTPTTEATVEPGSRLRRRAAGLSLVGAAGLSYAGILATPWENGSGTSTYLQSLVGHPRQAVIAAVLLHYGYLLFVPASFAMARLARRAARRLSTVGIALGVLGSGLSGLLVTDLYDLSIARHAGTVGGAPISEMKDVPLAALGFVNLGMTTAVGAIFGLVLLTLAMWRARLAPLWPSVAVLVGFALGFGAHDMPRAVAAFTLLCGGLGYVGVKVLRLTDEQFALGAAAR